MTRFFDLAILKPGFELARLFQNQGRFQNGQVNNLAVSKQPGFQTGQEHIHIIQTCKYTKYFRLECICYYLFNTHSMNKHLYFIFIEH